MKVLPAGQYIESCIAKIAEPSDENYTHGVTDHRQSKHLMSWYRTCSPRLAAFTEISEVIMAAGLQNDWRELCDAVTNESDSTKLSSLVQELIESLDKAERSWRHPICSPDAIATNREAAKEILYD